MFKFYKYEICEIHKIRNSYKTENSYNTKMKFVLTKLFFGFLRLELMFDGYERATAPSMEELIKKIFKYSTFYKKCKKDNKDNEYENEYSNDDINNNSGDLTKILEPVIKIKNFVNPFEVDCLLPINYKTSKVLCFRNIDEIVKLKFIQDIIEKNFKENIDEY